MLLCLAYLRTPASRVNWRTAARRFTLASLGGGLIWGLGAVWLMTPGNLEQQMLIVLVLAATVSGTIPAYGSYLPAAYAYFVAGFAALHLLDPFNSGKLNVIMALMAPLFF